MDEIFKEIAGSLRLETLDVKGLLHHAAASAETEIRAKGHKLTIEEPSRPVFVRGDSVRLEQVFNKLISNAVQHTPPGGSILARICMEGESAVIAVKDNGLGMDADTLQQLFEPGAQDWRDDESSEAGLGTGLDMTRRIVEMHGGNIAATSDGPGKGATFTVKLPRCDQEREG